MIRKVPSKAKVEKMQLRIEENFKMNPPKQIKSCDYYYSFFFINLKEIHKSLAYEYILLQYAIQTLLVFLDFTQVLHIKYLAFQNSVFRKSYGRISIDDELYEG